MSIRATTNVSIFILLLIDVSLFRESETFQIYCLQHSYRNSWNRATRKGTPLRASAFTSSLFTHDNDDNNKFDRSDLYTSAEIACMESTVPSDPQQTQSSIDPKTINEEREQRKTEWTVFICQSKACLERGAGATLGAFVGLSPTEQVTIQPVVLKKLNKGKGPNIRCIQKDLATNKIIKAFDVTQVDSVEKVYRILTIHMNLPDINPFAAKCLKYNYEGNAYLDKQEITLAIESYNKALATNYKDQEGVLLVMRSTAYLQRAYNHRLKLKEVVQDLTKNTPPPPASIQQQNNVSPNTALPGDTSSSSSVSSSMINSSGENENSESSLSGIQGEQQQQLGGPFQNLFYLQQLAFQNPSIANVAMKEVLETLKLREENFQKTKFYHGLYEYALLHAAQDSLRATQLLPNYAKTWLRAGDALAELRKLKEAARYYEMALELDPSLESTLQPIIQRLKKSQEFLDEARENGWTEDILRVALAVSG